MKPLFIAIAITLTALAAPANAASLDSTDATYLRTAIQVQFGRYAMAQYEERHGSGRVQSFAKTLASQSTQESRMLEGLAKRYGVTPAKGLSIQDEMHYGNLQGLSGDALNQAFIRELRISDNVDQYARQQEMQQGQNSTLKGYAKQRYDAVQSELSALAHM